MRFIILIVIIFWSNNVKCQINYDTSYIEEEMLVMNLDKRLLWKGNPSDFQDERRVYNKEGIKIKELLYTDETLNKYWERKWYENGIKKMELYVDVDKGYILKDYWDEMGNLIKNDITLDGKTRIVKKFYKNGKLEYITTYKYVEYTFNDFENFNGIEAKDTLNDYLFIEIFGGKAFWFVDSYTEFYENSNIKSTGKFSSKLFDIYALSNNEILFEKRQCNDGQWTYFNEDGTIKEVVYYENCLKK